MKPLSTDPVPPAPPERNPPSALDVVLGNIASSWPVARAAASSRVNDVPARAWIQPSPTSSTPRRSPVSSTIPAASGTACP